MTTLTDEQIRKIKKKEYDAERRKQKLREEYAEKKEADTFTPDVFWEKNRRSVDTAALLERQNFVFALLDDIQTAMEGRAPIGSTVEELSYDVEAEIREDVQEHGICGMEIMLLEFWKRPEMLQEMTLNQPTKTFVTLGFVTGIPSHRLHAWQEYLASKKPPTPQPSNAYVKMACSSPTCGNAITSTETVSEGVAADYARLGKPWLCTPCKNLELKSRAESTLVKGFR
jgi:hypothetical protein